MSDAIHLTAAVYAAHGRAEPAEVMALWSQARRLQRFLDVLDDSTVFRKRLEDVRIIKTESGSGEPLPGKAQLVLEPDEGSDEFETIETDWLDRPMARLAADVAEANVGEVVSVWKHNTEPTTDAPQGYRRCLWVDGPGSRRPGWRRRLSGADEGRGAVAPPGDGSPPPLTNLQRTVEAKVRSLNGDMKRQVADWIEEHLGGASWPYPDDVCKAILSKITELLEEPF